MTPNKELPLTVDWTNLPVLDTAGQRVMRESDTQLSSKLSHTKPDTAAPVHRHSAREQVVDSRVSAREQVVNIALFC